MLKQAHLKLHLDQVGQPGLEPPRVCHAVLGGLAVSVVPRGKQVGMACVKGNRRLTFALALEDRVVHFEGDRQIPVLAFATDLGAGGLTLKACAALHRDRADAIELHCAIAATVLTAGGHLEYPADGLDPVAITVAVDVGYLDLSLRSSSACAKNALAVFRMSFVRPNSLT